MHQALIRKTERIVGHRFRSKKLLRYALRHPSQLDFTEQNKESSLTFQRLEFLGDSILNLVIATRLYKNFPQANEGLLSQMRSILVSRKLLAKIARQIRFHSVVLTTDLKQNNFPGIREKILADTFEALIAAIYFDRGFKASERFLLKCFRSHFDPKKLFRFDPNPKSVLQEYAQKQFQQLPVYRVKRNRNGSFTAWVRVKTGRPSKGVGRTKQDAEIKAAAQLAKKLKIRRKKRLPV